MIYNTIVNGNSPKKTPYINPSSSSLYDNNLNKQKHVTFRVDGRHADQIIYPTNKPQYHFTYGQTSNNLNNAYYIKDQANARYSVQPNFQTFYDQFSIQKAARKISPGLDKSRSESKRKKRLKIFPQKYQSNKKIENKVEQKDEVLELKKQIEKLKLEIKNLSQNLSRNTSRELSQAQIFRNEAQRTRRLSQLNEFNEKLYQQLASKLKQISLVEYDNYLQKSNTNNILYDSIYSSSKKSNRNVDSGQKKSKYSQNFMDIKEFEEQYQRKYQSTGLQNIMKNTNNIPNDPEGQTDQIQSPFLLNQNKVGKWGQRFDATKPNFIKNTEKVQAFTFNKQKQHHQRHFSQPFKQMDNNPFIHLGQKDKMKIHRKRKIEESQRKKRLQQKLESQMKIYVQATKGGNKQIDDFNRQLETKILKKRINSQYSYLSKAKKY